jgi:hypothetical protein
MVWVPMIPSSVDSVREERDADVRGDRATGAGRELGRRGA